jgi:replicative DNA helicase
MIDTNIKPPSAVEIEKSIIASLIVESDSYLKISDLLKPEHFFLQENKIVFSTIKEMFDNNVPIDMMSVFDTLKKKNEVGTIGGVAYISKICNGFTTAANIEYHSKILIDKSILRGGISVAMQLASECYENADSFEVVTGAIERLNSLISIDCREEENLYDGIHNYLTRLEDISNNNSLSITSKKFPSFNRFTKGLKPGNVCTIAGSFKQGKTTLGLELITDIALQGVPAGIFSLEMNRDELYNKIVSSVLSIPYERLRDVKSLSNEDRKNLAMLYSKFQNSKLLISDKKVNEISLRNKALEWKKKYGVKIILIDYIGLLGTSKRLSNREQEVSYLSKFIKNLAGELNISIILLAQLNRTGAQSPDSLNVAESISIARDSDFFFSIHKPFDLGTRNIKLDNKNIAVDENIFFVKLNNSRHTKQGGWFLIEFKGTEMIELDTLYSDHLVHEEVI